VPYRRDDALDAGDIVWIDFGPPFGREQAGRRPALVVSPRTYNERSSLIVVCPITRNVGGWPFKVEIREDTRVQGAVIVDQVRSIDRVTRFARKTEGVGPDTLGRVYGMFAALFGIPVSNSDIPR
jgi:mRNA interferase MazF